MENEKLLPLGEPDIEITALPVLRSQASTIPSLPGVPSAKAQSLGTVISIIVIVLMIVIGAFYAWGQRIAQNQVFTTPTEIAQ